MIVRMANRQDINSMADLLEDLFMLESDFDVNRKAQLDGLSLILDDNYKGVIYVVEEKEQVIGMCSLQYLISTAEGGNVALMEDLIIKESYRKKGVGRELMKIILSHEKLKGTRRIQLLADKDNHFALDFYDKLDFNKTNLVAFRKMI